MAPSRQRSAAQHLSDLASAPGDDHQSEVTLQTHFWLTAEDIALLDTWVFQLRYNGWRRASRSACVRALVRLINDSPIDLESVTNEQEFVDALHAALLQHKEHHQS